MTDTPTRRALLTGDLARPEQQTDSIDADHISSAVVSVLPDRREEVITRLASLRGVELHHTSPFKLVIVLEGPGSGALGGMLAEISGWPGVLSANMVFEQRLERET